MLYTSHGQCGNAVYVCVCVCGGGVSSCWWPLMSAYVLIPAMGTVVMLCVVCVLRGRGGPKLLVAFDVCLCPYTSHVCACVCVVGGWWCPKLLVVCDVLPVTLYWLWTLW